MDGFVTPTQGSPLGNPVKFQIDLK